MQDMQFSSTELGKIQIADEVIQIIAGLAASEVPGVAGMSGSFAGGITESLLRRKNLGKGVNVEFGEEDKTCKIDVSVALEFGVSIPDTCMTVQENIKQAIESMTGLHVTSVDVHVSAVVFESDKTKEVAEVRGRI
jgi:uncharacterized alkaline shock family protein YloU